MAAATSQGRLEEDFVYGELGRVATTSLSDAACP